MPAKKVGKIYHTKKGQPYKILPSGKAMFIKKSATGKKGGSMHKKAGSVRVAGSMRRRRGGSMSVAGGLKKSMY